MKGKGEGVLKESDAKMIVSCYEDKREPLYILHDRGWTLS
jgi:hypothetical protein